MGPERRYRGLLWMIAAMALAGALYAGAAWMKEVSPFAIGRLVVRGNVRTPTDAVLAATGLEVGQPLFGQEAALVAGRVSAMPWVREARVERRLPETILVEVREWEPRYLVRLEGRLYYLTAEAHVVDAPLAEGLDFPVVTGLTWAQFEGPGPLREELRKLLALVEEGAFGGRLDEIHADADEGFTLYGSVPKPFAVLFGLGELEEKFERLSQLRRSLAGQEKYARSADLTLENRIVARIEPLRPLGAIQ